MINMNLNKYKAAILGLIVGDALGVPVEFMSRAEMKDNPVTDMIGYGTHNQPAGTWSDDSSMVIATVEWLGEIEDKLPEYSLLMEKFNNWLMYGDYTPYGEVFDCGISTNTAIINYGKGREPLECGGKSEWDNGNGSLMRILPAALHRAKGLAKDDMEDKEFIYNLSALTHGHLRSKMGCLIYAKLIADLFCNGDKNKTEITKKSIDTCKKYFDSLEDEEAAVEKEKYARLWNLPAFMSLGEEEIKSR